eukprot:106614-Amphidinium_carterae.1
MPSFTAMFFPLPTSLVLLEQECSWICLVDVISCSSDEVYGDLVNPDDTMMMHFVSHEWLGFEHPDPNGVQIALVPA